MDALSLIGLAVALLVLGPALAARALSRCSILSREVEALRARARRLEDRLDELRREGRGLSEEAEALDTGGLATGPTLAENLIETRREGEAAAVAASAEAPTGPPTPRLAPASADDKRSRTGLGAWFQGVPLEQFMGVKLFAWIGGLALFLAIAFFVKYSFERNLVPPELRVIAGFVSGAALLAGGVALKRRTYEVTSQTLCATGVVVLYAASYASHGFYDLVGVGVAFLLMTLVTAAAFLTAVRLEAKVVAVLGVLGGFLTPPLLSTGTDAPLALFGYVGLLDAGLVAVALGRRWHYLAALGAAGTALTQIGWAAEFFVAAKAPVAMSILLTFNLLFLGAAVVAEKVQQGNRWFAGAAASMAAVTFGFAFFFLTVRTLGERPGTVFSALLLGELCLLTVSALPHGWRFAHAASGGAVFLALAGWTLGYLNPVLLSWALVGYSSFGLLRIVPSILLPQLRGERGSTRPPVWGNLLPAVLSGLPFLLLMVATLRLDSPQASAPIFAVALALVALVLVAARRSGIGFLALVALGCAAGCEYVWLGRHFTVEHAVWTSVWFCGFTAVFFAFPFVTGPDFLKRNSVWVAAALAGPVHFFGLFRIVEIAWPNDFMGMLPAAFAIPSLFVLRYLAVVLPVEAENRTFLLAWFGGAALLFITLIFPIQFEREWLTLGWALEGLGLLWLYGRVPHPGLRGVGFGLLVLAFVRLALNPAVLGYHPPTGTPVFNWYLYAYGVTIACLFSGARLLAHPGARVPGLNGRAVLLTLGTVLCFVLVNLEIADFFAQGDALTVEFTGNLARGMTYSIAWALFAFGLLVVGVWQDQRPVRYAGLALMGVTLLKLFFSDLTQLAALYRIGAFLAVAVISILASVVYQRFFARTA